MTRFKKIPSCKIQLARRLKKVHQPSKPNPQRRQLARLDQSMKEKSVSVIKVIQRKSMRNRKHIYKFEKFLARLKHESYNQSHKSEDKLPHRPSRNGRAKNKLKGFVFSHTQK